MTMPALAYSGLTAELDRRQFDASVPALVMRQPRVGWGGQLSYRILGLRLALAIGRRAVFWGHDDPPYGQAFLPMFVDTPVNEVGAVPFDLDAAPKHPHNVARQTFVELGGVVLPAPAPRFSATPGEIQGPPPAIGAHDREALSDWGFSTAAIDELKAAGALAG